MPRPLRIALASILLYLPALQAQTGDAYRLFGNSIRVDRPSHWQNWEYQNDLVSALKVATFSSDIFEVDTEGLRPRFYRRNINVAPTARSFAYTDLVRANGDMRDGGATALSNNSLANNLIDGDLSTYWEPNSPTSYAERLNAPGDFDVEALRNWELEIDLGRLVFADSLPIVFTAGQFEGEFLGEPVKSFALFASMGERFPFPLGNRLQFTLIGQLATAFTSAPKSAQEGGDLRLVSTPGSQGRYAQVTFPLAPLTRADWDGDGLADVTGGFVHYLRIKITDSDLWRDFALGAGEEARIAYEDLPQERRGALVYQRRTAGGLLVEIAQEAEGLSPRDKYENLPQDKRGPILYFGREVPRISEVQVWAKGDNYAFQPEQRAGGSFENGGLGAPHLATDGLYDTEWQANTWSPIYDKGTAWYDLGAVFWARDLYVVNKRVQAYSNLEGAFTGPNILVSDGTLLKPLSMQQLDDFPQLEESLKWDNIIPEEHADNRDARVRIFHEDLGLRKIRFLQVRDVDISGETSGSYGFLATPAEIQLYGEGYPVSVWAYSPPISLTDARGEFIRKTLPRIAWQGDVIVRTEDPATGRVVERIEPLENHPDVRLQVQTRTSDQTDTNFTYYQVVEIAGAEERGEVTKEVYEELVLSWAAWDYWNTLSSSEKHVSNTDDDGDGITDEDPIDFVDNDGDGQIDEDGKKLRRAPRSSFDRDGKLAFVGWSEWSESYAPTGGRYEAVITSPNPRRFLQVRVNITSEDPYKTARIRSVRVDLAPPLSLELAGELALLTEEGKNRPVSQLAGLPQDYAIPTGIDPLSQQQFSYFIRAAAPDPADATVRDGFDEVLIVTPRAAQLIGVRTGIVSVSTTTSPLDPTASQTAAVSSELTRSYARGEDGIFRNGEGGELLVLAANSDSLWLRFPAPINTGLQSNQHALVEVQFTSQSFREGIEYSSFVRATDGDEGVFQRVDTATKDATELVDSSTARVSLMELSDQLIQDVAMRGIFTPNGDGINDELVVRFALLKVLEERPLSLEFYDLSGRLVGRGQSRGTTAKVGTQEFSWDGRNPSGALVPPGMYLARIVVEADQGDSDLMRTIAVAY